MTDMRRASTKSPGERRRRKASRSAKRRPSSARWLSRQRSDPYVAQAARRGYRSRAAWKLVEIDDRFGILAPGRRVVDLGAAPGGWAQVAAERVAAKAGEADGMVVAVDPNGMEPIAGVRFAALDIRDPSSRGRIAALLDGPADAVLSDMAAPATGRRAVDHLRSVALCEAAHTFARGVLASGGALLLKLLDGTGSRALRAELDGDFSTVKTVKPRASRAQSAELYLLATGFRGRAGCARSEPSGARRRDRA